MCRHWHNRTFIRQIFICDWTSRLLWNQKSTCL